MALPPAEWTRSWDAKAMAPWLRRRDGGMVISFDDMTSIGLKCQYVRETSAAGVMIWALGEDHRSGRPELLEVVGRSFGVR